MGFVCIRALGEPFIGFRARAVEGFDCRSKEYEKECAYAHTNVAAVRANTLF